MSSFTDLEAWKIGVRLVKGIFVAMDNCRYYHLADQLRRASTSVMTNMAEGFGRSTDAEKKNRYIIARGECTEVIALLIVATEIGVVKKEISDPLRTDADSVGRMLTGLIRRYSSA